MCIRDRAYTMAGILMDAKTGLPVLTGEGAKKYAEDDLTKFTSGLMNVLGFQSNTCLLYTSRCV